MAEGKSPLDGILEEGSTPEKEAKPFTQSSSNHKSESAQTGPSTTSTTSTTSTSPLLGGPADDNIRRIRNLQADDAQYIANRLKQLEDMIFAMRMIIGFTALVGAYNLWKVRKFDAILDEKKAKKREAIVEVEASKIEAAPEVGA